MNDYIVEGYVWKLMIEEVFIIGFRIWYFLYFVVINCNKLNKVWMVFDVVVEYKGILLNKNLLLGFDYINSLVGVLLRLCEDKVVLVGDIKSMFY